MSSPVDYFHDQRALIAFLAERLQCEAEGPAHIHEGDDLDALLLTARLGLLSEMIAHESADLDASLRARWPQLKPGR